MTCFPPKLSTVLYRRGGMPSSSILNYYKHLLPIPYASLYAQAEHATIYNTSRHTKGELCPLAPLQGYSAGCWGGYKFATFPSMLPHIVSKQDFTLRKNSTQAMSKAHEDKYNTDTLANLPAKRLPARHITYTNTAKHIASRICHPTQQMPTQTSLSK